MFNSGNGYSLADIAAATGSNRSNGGGFGDGDGAWWIILLFLFAAMGGWGNGGGFGGLGGGGGNSVRDAVSYGFDINGLENGIRGIQQGLCDGFYAMNTGMLNGFSGVNNVLSGEFRTLDNAVCTLGYQAQAGFNDVITNASQNTNAIVGQLTNMTAQNAACCCETQRQIERGFCDLNYNLATQSCDTRRAIADSTRDIVDNANNNTRAILDFLTQDKIASLTAENQTLKFAASQERQNNFLVKELGPKCPIPAYQVPNPFANYGCGCNPCGAYAY